jgi:hypothetical protein
LGVFMLKNWADWLDEAGATNVDPAASGLHFNVADHALDAAIGGGGVVLGRTCLAEPDIRAGRLVTPFDLKLKADFSFYVISLETRKTNLPSLLSGTGYSTRSPTRTLPCPLCAVPQSDGCFSAMARRASCALQAPAA